VTKFAGLAAVCSDGHFGGKGGEDAEVVKFSSETRMEGSRDDDIWCPLSSFDECAFSGSLFRIRVVELR
jgi:hypothetical protein